MAKRFSKKHLLWQLPLLLVLLLLVAATAALGLAHARGWRWHGLVWEQGPMLNHVTWHDGGCLRLQAEDVRLHDIWPLQLTAASVHLPACAAEQAAALPTAQDMQSALRLLALLPFKVNLAAVRYQDYPVLAVQAWHHDEHLQLRVHWQGGRVHANYGLDTARWQVTGIIQAAAVQPDLAGRLAVDGAGLWRPDAEDLAKQFSGQLHLAGKRLGRQEQGPHANLSIHASWQGESWKAVAELERPVALAQDWLLVPGQGLRAAGRGLSIRQVDVDLTLQGPQAEVALALHSDADNLARGHGRLALSGNLGGEIELDWEARTLTVTPFTIAGPHGTELSLVQPLTLPLALQGELEPALVARYGSAEMRTTDSHLYWSGTTAYWQGAVMFGGHWQGYQLGGGWSGTIAAQGPQGEPLLLTLDKDELHLRAQLPMPDSWQPAEALTAQLKGQYQVFQLTANLTAAATAGGWGGTLQAAARMPWLAQGGELDLQGQWQWRDGLQLLAGARLEMAQGMLDDTLLRSARLVADTPISLGPDGVHGSFHLQMAGLVAARWVLPPVRAAINADGWDFKATMQVPQWDSKLTVTGQDLNHVPRGQLSGTTSLQPVMSRGLEFTTREGSLRLRGHWRLGTTPSVNGHLQARDVALDWGSITADGMQAAVDVRWQPGHVQVSSSAPLTVAELDVGVPITQISLQLDSDLQHWQFHDIHASLLDGRVSAAALDWPARDYQPVELANIQVAQLAALQNKPVVNVSGRVGGTVPVRLHKEALSIRDGWLTNATPLSLSLRQSEGVRAMEQANQSVDLALDAINPMQIKVFQARIDMSADGWLDAAMTIKGRNPERGIPVVLNYTHQENMYKLLRSLRIGKQIVDTVMGDIR